MTHHFPDVHPPSAELVCREESREAPQSVEQGAPGAGQGRRRAIVGERPGCASRDEYWNRNVYKKLTAAKSGSTPAAEPNENVNDSALE